MAKRKRKPVTSLAEADARFEALAGWLRRVGQPHRQVGEVIEVAAFYRGVVHELQEQLKQHEGDGRWTRKVSK